MPGIRLERFFVERGARMKRAGRKPPPPHEKYFQEKVERYKENLLKKYEYLGMFERWFGVYDVYLVETIGPYLLLRCVGRLLYYGKKSWGVMKDCKLIDIEKSQDRARRNIKYRLQQQEDRKEAKPHEDIMIEIVKAGYKQIAKNAHPDKGGNHCDMIELNAAKDDLFELIAVKKQSMAEMLFGDN